MQLFSFRLARQFSIRPSVVARALLTVAASVLFAGCARINDAGLGLVTTKVDAFAVVNGQVVSGNVYLIPDRTGRVVLGAEQEDAASSVTCGGVMRYTGTFSGTMDLHCSDGSGGAIPYNLVTETRGFANGGTAAAPVSLVFGVSEAEAIAYLTAPAGHHLVARDEGGLELK